MCTIYQNGARDDVTTQQFVRNLLHGGQVQEFHGDFRPEAHGSHFSLLASWRLGRQADVQARHLEIQGCAGLLDDFPEFSEFKIIVYCLKNLYLQEQETNF